MTGPATYRIELRGRRSDDILAPYRHEFIVSRTADNTVLVGQVRDPAHLHGIVNHLTIGGFELLGATATESTDTQPELPLWQPDMEPTTDGGVLPFATGRDESS